MKTSAIPVLLFLLFILPSNAPATDCTGVPDLDRCIIRQTFAGPATVLVIPDGTGPPVTEARTAAGAVVDATIHLTVITSCEVEEPVADFPREDMWLESIGGGLAACRGGTIADFNTDAAGLTQWSLPMRAGGHDEGNCRVVVNGMYLGDAAGLSLNFNSPDIGGDGVVNLADVYQFTVDYFGPYAFRSDLIRDGVVNLSDVAVLAGALGRSCP